MSQVFARTASTITLLAQPGPSSYNSLDHEPVASRNPRLKEEVRWIYSEHQLPQEERQSTLPIREVFTYLYGLLPCNLYAFLRMPVDYLNAKEEYVIPFAKEYDEPTLDLKYVGLYSEVSHGSLPVGYLRLNTFSISTAVLATSFTSTTIDILKSRTRNRRPQN